MRALVVLVWEGTLGLLVAVMVAVAVVTAPSGHLLNVLGQAGPSGLVAAGLALSLRAGTPNLAVGALAGFTAAVTASPLIGQGWAAAILALLLVAIGGLVLGLLVAALAAPAWAVTLGAAVACEALVVAMTDSRGVPSQFGSGIPASVWFVLFVVVSLGGALVWRVARLRSPWVAALVGVGGSSLLAAVGGLAALARVQAVFPGTGWSTTTLALAAVLLGGVSVHGGRGGVAGTVLAMLFLALVQGQLAVWGAPFWAFMAVTGVVVVVALLAGRLVDLAVPEPIPAPGDAPVEARTNGPRQSPW
ncbi:hypothetical protein HTZ77_33810 [Nonomuraea sp. SMC257]|uniref:ABC transporter permease n=1 Tax=Nonomuraea montanisoli TaxID=2741721 RepID=A0A7Y6M7H1_9ACTN|nr:hypothetical protein [Nonomuraea montanisoli]NUW36349.1 hypothetical protein [Nonomuraea montanisoli]